jgi:hypothetical protein
MDIILLIFACFWISRRAKENGLNPTSWVLRLIGIYIVFEITGVLISFSITGGNTSGSYTQSQMVMAGLFGFVCAVGGFLLIRYNLDKKIAQQNQENNKPDSF